MATQVSPQIMVPFDSLSSLVLGAEDNITTREFRHCRNTPYYFDKKENNSGDNFFKARISKTSNGTLRQFSVNKRVNMKTALA